jgi:hypothetical protein
MNTVMLRLFPAVLVAACALAAQSDPAPARFNESRANEVDVGAGETKNVQLRAIAPDEMK